MPRLGFGFGQALTFQSILGPAISAPSAYSDAALATLTLGPIGYYRLDEESGSTAADSSGNGYDGTYVNTTLDQEPLIQDGRAVSFDGSGDKVQLPAEYGGFGNGNWSCALWAKPAVVGEPMRMVGIGSSSANNFGWYVSTNGSNRVVFFWVDTSDSFTNVVSNYTTAVDERVFVVAVRDGNTNRLYINGVEDNTNTLDNNGTLNSADSVQLLGSQGGNNPPEWNGVLDEVAIFDYALDPDDIQNLYLVGLGEEVSALSIAVVSYDSQFYDVSSRSADPTGFRIRPNGEDLWVLDPGDDRVYEYNMTTPWDLDTMTYSTTQFNASGQTDNPRDIAWKPDGLKFFLTGTDNNRLYQYTCSSAWQINTASYDSVSFNIGAQATSAQKCVVRDNGTQFYILDFSSTSIYQYSMSVAWDLSTASYASKLFDISTEVTEPAGFWFQDDGKRMFVADRAARAVYQYDLSTAWDVSTAAYNLISADISAQEAQPYDVQLVPEVSKMFTIGREDDRIYRFSI